MRDVLMRPTTYVTIEQETDTDKIHMIGGLEEALVDLHIGVEHLAGHSTRDRMVRDAVGRPTAPNVSRENWHRF